MNIQIFGKSKCFDTKKAERYFKERGIKFQSIDIGRYGISKGEFASVKNTVSDLSEMMDLDTKNKDLLILIQHLSNSAAEEKLLENPKLFKTPIVRNGKKATIGYAPEVWKNWE